jgi:hypothetical protein
LFRGHVAERPDDGAGFGQRDLRLLLAASLLLFVQLGDPEVEQLAEVIAGDHDVLRLDIAVQDARRVRVDQRFQQRPDQRERLRKRQRAAPQPVAQSLTLDELHRQEGDALRLAGLEERGDGRMLQARAGLRLAKEARARRILTAAGLPSARSRARKTSPMPPAPRRLSTR